MSLVEEPTQVIGGPGSFHGLFVGVDNFASPAIQSLKFAKADASALHALFLDGFGDGARLLRDAEVTRAHLTAELESLARVSTANDLVVITYSGHGSRTQELATYDTDPRDLATTAMPLEEFVELVTAIPARLLLVVLDCCFSGAAAAKVLSPLDAPRGGADMARSVEAVLGEVTGTGRVVITAATANQEAREDWRRRHGVFTYYLIEALLGADEVVQAGRVSVLKMVSFIQSKVASAQSACGRPRQDPTLRGMVDGEMYLPVLRPGRHYRTLSGGHLPAPATSELNSLLSHGLTDAVLTAWSQEIPTLNQLQIAAVNEGGVLAGNAVLVSAPTSTGKTFVGIMAALRAVQRGGRSVFLLPTRALVNELHERLDRMHRPIGVRTIRATGEYGDHLAALLGGEYDLAVLTYEKFAHLTLRQPELLAQIGVLVIDEVQTLGNVVRGPLLELLLMLVKVRQVDGEGPQIVALSAVLSGLDGLDTWLGATPVVMTTRPVPLEEGVLDIDGTYMFRDAEGNEATESLLGPCANKDDLLVSMVERLVTSDQQVIVFQSTKVAACSSAEKLGAALDLPAVADVLADLDMDDGSRVGARLCRCLAQGVAFHTADVDADERQLLERRFRMREIRVLVTTTTLAHGVNLPADVVIICELEHPGGVPYTVAEYKNMAGRAGRVGLVERGRSIVLANGKVDARRKWHRYVTASPERLRSALLDPGVDLRSLALYGCAGILASSRRPAVPDASSFLSWSFAAHQCRIVAVNEPFPQEAVDVAVEELLSCGLVRHMPAGVALTPLGEVAAWRNLSIDSVIAISSALAEISAVEINRTTLIAAVQLAIEIRDCRFSCDRRAWRGENERFAQVLRGQNISAGMLMHLQTDLPDEISTNRLKRCLACLGWIQGLPVDTIERGLTAFLPLGEQDRFSVPVRRTAKRTADILGAVLDIATNMHPTEELGLLGSLLSAQLRLGVVPGLVPVARHAGRLLGRKHYCNMTAEGFVDARAILAADDELLLGCVDGDRRRCDALLAAASTVESEQTPVDLGDLLKDDD